MEQIKELPADFDFQAFFEQIVAFVNDFIVRLAA